MKISQVMCVRKSVVVRLATGEVSDSPGIGTHALLKVAGCPTTRSRSDLLIAVPDPRDPEWPDVAHEVVDEAACSVVIGADVGSARATDFACGAAEFYASMSQFDALIPLASDVDAVVRLWLGFLLRETQTDFIRFAGVWQFRHHVAEGSRTAARLAEEFRIKRDHGGLIDTALMNAVRIDATPSSAPPSVVMANAPYTPLDVAGTETKRVKPGSIRSIALYPSIERMNSAEIALLVRSGSTRPACDWAEQLHDLRRLTSKSGFWSSRSKELRLISALCARESPT
ncbi:MAG: hypothetical protein IPG63_07595 [Xanthomonadales bacterium]|nr:hypothetical protein [Xanthomonadales bacterium]MCC6562125.1 hypothetical protein [Xanthomonadales bacterium]